MARLSVRSLEEKTEEKRCYSRRKVMKQRVRVIYTDPDATDCSGDEKDSRFSFVRKDVNGLKRMVGEVYISGCGDGSNRGSDASTSGNKTIMPSIPVIKPKTEDLTDGVSLLKRSSSKYKGVRKRKWGKFASEIRNPLIGNKREWLGTFNTELEAHIAYEKKKREIDALLDLEKRNTPSAVSTSSVSKLAVATSTVSKLAVATSTVSKLAVATSTVTSSVSKPAVATSTVSKLAVATSTVLTSAVPKSAVVESAAVSRVVCALAATVQPDVNPPGIHQGSTSAVATSEDEHGTSMGNLLSPSSVLDVNRCTPSSEVIPQNNNRTVSVSSSFFGTNFNYLFDEIKIEDLPMCDLGFGLSDLPNFDLDITNADLNFIDDLLEMTGI